jgi:hypothetical protein
LGGTKSFRAQAAEFFFRNRVGHPAPCKGVHTLKINYIEVLSMASGQGVTVTGPDQEERRVCGPGHDWTKCGPYGEESRSRPKIRWAKYAAIEAESESVERNRSSVATRRMRGRRRTAAAGPAKRGAPGKEEEKRGRSTERR